jgi:nucleoside-diphosphate-sugar epimerase
MSLRALVTGGTGMLGSYIVERLLAGGWSVRVLTRPGSAAVGSMGAATARCGVESVRGCLEDGPSLVSAAAGCDAVFHAAAVIGSGGDWSVYRRGNVEGTGNVVRAAGAAGARLVHVSSTAVYGRERYRSEPTDERAPLPELPAHDVYGRSKQDAENAVLEAHRGGRVWATVVRPPVMYGRRDRQFAPRVGAVLERGFFPRVSGGLTTLAAVHAGSVAEGAVLAAGSAAAGGQVYLLANDYPVTVTDLVRCAAEGLGRRIWSPSVPASTGRAGFAALAWALQAAGRADLARHAAGTLDMLTRDNPFTSERARSELGWAPSGCRETHLVEAFRWWKTQASKGAGAG